MDTKTQAQIYLADQRGLSETNDFRSYHSFNFGSYADESRNPFGSLRLLNDDTLRAGASLTMLADDNIDVLLLPISGGLEYTIDLPTGPATGFLEPVQLGIFSLAPGATYTVSNPYETEHINCLQIWLTRPLVDRAPTITQTSFDLTPKNVLVPLFDLTDTQTSYHSKQAGFIGQYNGRQEGIYHIQNSASASSARGVFVFVLQGAFEVQNRLLHEKDGLALLTMQDELINFEALSNEAILLLIEVPVQL